MRDIFSIGVVDRILLFNIFQGNRRWKDLYEATGIADSTLAGKIKKLHEMNLIESEIDPSDRRVKIYKLTKEGEEIAKEIKNYLTVAELAKNEIGKRVLEFREDRRLIYFTDFWYNGWYSGLPDSMMFLLEGTPTRGIIIVTKSGDAYHVRAFSLVSKAVYDLVFVKKGDGFEVI